MNSQIASSLSEEDSTISDNIHKFSYQFPAVINGKINITLFLSAVSELVRIVERLGKAFAPVKYDMQGNIEKITNNYQYDVNSCLLELMKDEINRGSDTTVEGVLWLNRAILFFELLFQEILSCLRSKDYNVSMKKIFTISYEGSVKKYHGWVTQKLFSLICKIAPDLPEVLKTLDVNDDMEGLEKSLSDYNTKLSAVRRRIEEFFSENNLFVDPQ